jgi:serine/threonine protein kinase
MTVAAASLHDPLAPGRRVGKYEVVSRLASGGMAEIYLARAKGIQGFEKHVVLKRILPQFAANQTFVRLFLNEARVAATLDHPHIASVYDIGEADGVYFFTMEYLHGEDTGHILTQLAQKRVRFPIEHALTIGIGVAAGLHFAHEKKGPDGQPLGIVHRDVSPSNVVVTYDGGVKLVDFGIAKMTSHAEFTGTGSLKGKIAYMSPEQCASQPIDRRSDVFSLGVLLYEMSTHTRLFKADTEVATLQNVREAIVPPPSSRVSGYPPELEAIVKKALARRPVDRFSTTRELQMALEGFAQKAGIVLSNAVLAEWMEKTFGPKVEPWRGQPASIPSDPTRVTPTGARASAITTAESDHASVTDPVVEARRQRRIWTALAVTGMLATAGTVIAFRNAWRSYDQSSRPAPILVVSEQGSVAVEGAGAAEGRAPGAAAVPAATAPSVPAAASAPAGEGERAEASEPQPVKRAKPRAPSPAPGPGDPFSAAFARKEKEIERCFGTFPLGAAEMSAGQMAVRFRADRDGRVLLAEVLPDALARTPLGECVARVARTTEFGPQREPVAFRIPVTFRRRAAGGSSGAP